MRVLLAPRNDADTALHVASAVLVSLRMPVARDLYSLLACAGSTGHDSIRHDYPSAPVSSSGTSLAAGGGGVGQGGGGEGEGLIVDIAAQVRAHGFYIPGKQGAG